jgi:hypothetical protein
MRHHDVWKADAARERITTLCDNTRVNDRRIEASPQAEQFLPGLHGQRCEQSAAAEQQDVAFLDTECHVCLPLFVKRFDKSG